MEDAWLGRATERMFLPIVRMLQPEVVDMSMPPEGVFHNLVIVSVKKSYPGQARKVMYGIWSIGLMMLTKNIVVVDEDVDVHDPRDVVWRVTNNIDPRRDVVFVDGPLDALDFASPAPHYGSKMGIDGTRKGPLDGHTRPWPEEVRMSPEIKALVDNRWAEYGLDLG
jgi:4-hydroxy-3-polyprenylbenzoate decarboxylase